MSGIPVSIFITIIVFFLILIYASFKLDKNNPLTILSAISSTTLGYMSSLMILNGEVTQVYVVDTDVYYIPVQSLPIHYFLLGLSVIMGFMTVMLVLGYISTMISTGLEDSN